jgi:hypothetical protein
MKCFLTGLLILPFFSYSQEPSIRDLKAGRHKATNAFKTKKGVKYLRPGKWHGAI